MRYLSLIILLALVLITSGCVTSKPAVTPQETITIVPTPTPTPTPEPTVTRPLSGIDPIIGSWDNGMVFNADGSVGSDRNITWKANDMLDYSYFVTIETRAMKNGEGGRATDPTAISTEWIYNPYSDTIHIRDSSVAARRVLLVMVTATPAPTGT
jgi:hypothetical protein